jgi:beta propeller repeat protein
MKKIKWLLMSVIIITMTSSILCATSWSEFWITTNTSDQQNPAIYGNIVVWEDFRYGKDIYGYDLVTSTEFPICAAPYWQENPAIYGNIVVWEEIDSSSSPFRGMKYLFRIAAHIPRQNLYK